MRQKGKGPELIKVELKRKGISQEIISKTLFEGKESSENNNELLKTLARQKIRQLHGLPVETASRRLLGFLARRGFSLEVIKEVLKEIKKDLIQDDD